MNKLMDLDGIYVVKNGKRIPYSRMYLNDRIVNYFPCEYDNEMCEDFGISHVIFLPISMESFNKPGRLTRYCGYQYTFKSSQLQTILTDNENVESITHVQMVSEVRRFKYKIKAPLDVIIERIYEPLYPERIIDINALTSNIPFEILKITMDLINSFNAYYINKEI